MTVTLTVGTNTYAALADAEAYFTERLYITAWSEATTDDKSKALIMATRAIDRLALIGKKYDISQTLQFPRAYVYDTRFISKDTIPSAIIEEGWYYQADVPQEVKNACFEEALALLDFGDSKRTKLQRRGVQSFSLGSMSETYRAGVISHKGLLSPDAKEFMKPYILGAVVIL